MRKSVIDNIEAMKMKLNSASDEAIKLRNVKLEEFQNKVEQSRKLLTARQELLNQQIKDNKTRKKVDARIEKGLEGLQRLIESLRENLVESTLLSLSACDIVLLLSRIDSQDLFGTGIILEVVKALNKPKILSINMVPPARMRKRFGLGSVTYLALVRWWRSHFTQSS